MATDSTQPDTPEEETGILSDTGSVDASGIGFVSGHTEVVDLSFTHDDDLYEDAGVVDEDITTGEVVLDTDALIEAAAAAHAPAAAVPAAVEEPVEVEPEIVEESVTVEPVAAESEVVEPEPEPEVVAPAASVAAASVPAPAAAVRESVEEPAPATAVPVTVASDIERVTVRHEVALASKRLGELEADRETPDLLTADRLIDRHQAVRPEPEGAWRQFVYSLSGRRINLGDSKRARARKALDRRIAAPLPGGARFVPVLSRKGGVGKTTITALLGMALADAREDRVIAVDANPDRGTLAERITRANGKTVRDLVRLSDEVQGYNDFSNIVARDETRLDVLASDADPRVSEAFNDNDYRQVASIAAHYYSIVLTDTGTGIVHSVMGATLDLADQIVVVAGLSVDEARLASETLTWLETNGFSEQVRNAVVVLNTARPGTPLVRADEVEAHFRTRVRDVVRMPYDPIIATGSTITFRDLNPATRQAARELAAKVVEGLRVLAPAA
jgi:MinD-like ATPase involved in chromosome partitioning or flagellar assembly